MASPVVATPVPPGAVPSSVTTNSSDSSHTDGATSSNNNARSDTPPAEQHYSLKWNDYSLKLVTAFQNLRDEEDFVDVTVACDGHQYSAHKMVLSACSPYFRSMLKANPCQHPIVILKDVGHLELERLLEFMYNGEVNIAQDQLAAFLRTAENLKIRGLAGSSDDMEQMCNTSISNDKKDNSLKDDDDSDVLNEGYSSATKKRKLMSLDEQGNNKSNMKHEPCEGSENLCDVYGNDAQEQMMAAELYTAGVRGGGDDGNSSADTSGQHNEEGDVSTLMAIANAVQVPAPSERPIKCPLCLNIIKHARNLRRHVFKRHLSGVQGAEFTDTDVKNLLEKKLRSITVTPLTEEELREVQQRIRRKGFKTPRKKKGLAALPAELCTTSINESEVTIRKLPTKKDSKKTGLNIPHTHHGLGAASTSGTQQLCLPGSSGRGRSGENEEVINLAMPSQEQSLASLSMVAPHTQQTLPQGIQVPAPPPITLAMTQNAVTAAAHPRLHVDATMSHSAMQLSRDLVTPLTFDHQAVAEASYQASQSQVAVSADNTPSSSSASYVPGCYWATPAMAAGISFQAHQPLFGPTQADYFASAGIHVPQKTLTGAQHRKKSYQ